MAMNFTKEDILKIRKWLLEYSKKDSSLEDASTPLIGDEYLSIVQSGSNKKITVGEIVSQFFLLGVSDFLDVSNTYGSSYITLEAAVSLIPSKSRKIGQVITFLDTNGNWQIYQFRGTSVSQWNTYTLWKNFVSLVVTSSLEPDGEDLTKSDPNSSGISYLSFKNKSYSQLSHSGLGKVYLRKNIKTVNDYLTGSSTSLNILEQSMLPSENTVYIVQYDYDLNGVPVTVPAGSVLRFEGGSVSRGTVTCVSTVLEGLVERCSCTFAGTYKVHSFYPGSEDLTVGSDYCLKLADKAYLPSAFSGEGRVYLRQNIQTETRYRYKVDFSTVPTADGVFKIAGVGITVHAASKETVTVTVTSGATADGNIVLTLGGTTTTLAVTSASHSTPELVAAALASATGFSSEYTSAVSGAVITFTAIAAGPKQTPSFTPSSTGVAATVTDKAGTNATSLQDMASVWVNGGAGNSQLITDFTAVASGNSVTFTANSFTTAIPDFTADAGTTGVTYTFTDLSSNEQANVLTSDMLQQANTRYIFQYSYDLIGETVKVPSGCTFVFDGGSVSNGNFEVTGTLKVLPQPVLYSQLPNISTGKFATGQMAVLEDAENTLQFFDGNTWKKITAS